MTEIAEIEDPELHRSRDRAIRLFEYLEPEAPDPLTTA
jgi:hypothetical protein